jgi:glycosyltransferase involved in cell wall biosynthesis
MGNKPMLSGGLRTRGITKQSHENTPLITVVTVVRNGEKTLEETILSVINQTYTNIEYIVVDGASTDSTLDIVRKYEDRIDYWISEPDKGIYDAMNKGIDLATGEYIALLNSDDWYEKDACEIVAKRTIEEKYDVYYGMARVVDSKNNKSMFVYGNEIYAINYKMIAHPTCFISKEIYSKFNYNIKYKSASDYDFIIKIYKSNASFCFIEKTMVNFRTGGMSQGYENNFETIEIKKKYGFISLKYFYIWRIIYFIVYLYNKILKK